MPKDCSLPVAVEVAVAGNRRARVVASDTAGSFRLDVVGHGWVSRLATVGWLDRDQTEAAELLAALFDQAGMAPRVCGSYDGRVGGEAVDFGLERETRDMAAARRRLDGMLGAVASRDSATVQATVLWDMPPASVQALQRGLSAVAAAIRRPRRR